MKSGQLILTLLLAVSAASCQPGVPSGLVTFDVSEDGTVAIYLTDAAGAIVAPDDVYLQVRGVRTSLQYAGQGEVETFCVQLPKAGPLELRLTAGFEFCPEVHASGIFYSPPEQRRPDGTTIEPNLVAPAQRCTDRDSVLLHTAFWLPSNCENIRGSNPTYPTADDNGGGGSNGTGTSSTSE